MVGPRVTVPARHHVDPVLDALDRLVDWASWRIDRPSVELIAATVRDALERHREERDAAENRYQRATEDIGRLMARDQRLTEGLREISRIAVNGDDHAIPDPLARLDAIESVARAALPAREKGEE